MSRPQKFTLNKKQIVRVVSMFRRGTKNVQTIAETLNVPRRQVMVCLELYTDTSYSDGSYN